jgi:hypothetical protein
MVEQILSIRALAQLRPHPARPLDVVLMGTAVLATALAQASPEASGHGEACGVVSGLQDAVLPIPETELAFLLLERRLAALRIEALPAYPCARAVLEGVRKLAYGARSSLFDGFALPGLVGDEGTDFYPWLTENELGGPNGAWARLADLQRQVRRRFEESDLRQFPVRPTLHAFQAEIFREDSEIRHRLIGASLVRPYPKHIHVRVIDDHALYETGDLQHLGYDRRACAVILASGERLAVALHRQDFNMWLEDHVRAFLAPMGNITIIGSAVGNTESTVKVNYSVTTSFVAEPGDADSTAAASTVTLDPRTIEFVRVYPPQAPRQSYDEWEAARLAAAKCAIALQGLTITQKILREATRIVQGKAPR